MKATPVIMRMKGPPTRTARFNDRLSLTVMNRTTSWGCASTPMPTPRTSVVTMVSQMDDPGSGMDAHPVIPPAASAPGTRSDIAARAVCASMTPPSWM